MQETRVQSLGQDDPLAQEMETTPIFLPGKLHEQRLEDYSPWGHKELDRTELLSTWFITGMYEGHAVKQKEKDTDCLEEFMQKLSSALSLPGGVTQSPVYIQQHNTATHVPCFA